MYYFSERRKCFATRVGRFYERIPLRFYNGGILFSSIAFVCIAIISLYSFLLLVKTKLVVTGSFGGNTTSSSILPRRSLVSDIGGVLYGPVMRYVILGSVVVSQIGFVSAYTIFVAQNFEV